MREAIRTRLIEEIPELGDRIYDAYLPGPETQKPYVVISIGGENRSNISMGFDVPVNVWPYVDRTSFSEVDRLVSKIVNVLLGVDLVIDNAPDIDPDENGEDEPDIDNDNNNGVDEENGEEPENGTEEPEPENEEEPENGEEPDELIFRLRYTGTSNDVYDEVWKALTKQISFMTETIRGG